MARASVRRYAQALFQIASEQNLLDQLRSDLDTIGATAQYAELAAVMDSPRVPFEGKEDLARRQFDGLHPVAVNLILLLITKGRFDLAPGIAREFSALVDEAKGVAHAEVTTAVVLSGPEQQTATQRLSALTGKEIILHAKVDPSIIGGLIAKIGDNLIDGSTRTRLYELRRSLVQAAR